ncbi:hypothetical protein BDZ89DRAFT_451356 [Hymenopellis radicata]|nr:hypothetical protein BDZ89DRAFT_451356 [Hymenopellis radicata]
MHSYLTSFQVSSCPRCGFNALNQPPRACDQPSPYNDLLAAVIPPTTALDTRTNIRCFIGSLRRDLAETNANIERLGNALAAATEERKAISKMLNAHIALQPPSMTCLPKCLPPSSRTRLNAPSEFTITIKVPGCWLVSVADGGTWCGIRRGCGRPSQHPVSQAGHLPTMTCWTNVKRSYVYSSCRRCWPVRDNANSQ